MTENFIFDIGDQVFVIDREEVGVVIEVEHINDYVLDDASFEAPKLPSYRLSTTAGEIWRKASEIRAIPGEISACVIDQLNEPGEQQ